MNERHLVSRNKREGTFQQRRLMSTSYKRWAVKVGLWVRALRKPQYGMFGAITGRITSASDQTPNTPK